MPHQLSLIKEEATEYIADESVRAAYAERLCQHLQDPEFRAIEGFPIGEDEATLVAAILALSDPPHYTACPNPFLPEILEQWQAERAQLRQELGLPDDANDNGGAQSPISHIPIYHREPFASDVSEGKGGAICNRGHRPLPPAGPLRGEYGPDLYHRGADAGGCACLWYIPFGGRR